MFPELDVKMKIVCCSIVRFHCLYINEGVHCLALNFTGLFWKQKFIAASTLDIFQNLIRSNLT